MKKLTLLIPYYLDYIKNANGQETCVIRMFGITAESNSVAVHVHNFTPYFYVKVNPANHAKFDAEDLSSSL